MDRNALLDGIEYVRSVMAELNDAARTAERDFSDDEQAAYDAGSEYIAAAVLKVERPNKTDAELKRASEFLEAHPKAGTVDGDGARGTFNSNVRTEDPYDLGSVQVYGSR